MKTKISGMTGMTLSAAVALALSAAGAQANTIDWGVHDAVETDSQHVAKGSFDDVFSFSLPSASDLLSFAVSVEKVVFVGPPPKDSKSIFHIDDGMVKLYQGVFGDATPDTQVLSYHFTDDAVFHTSGHLAPGSYFYEVSGNGAGQGGGFFNLTSTLTPVPEPQTYGMLLAGLGLMGVVARRRMQSDS